MKNKLGQSKAMTAIESSVNVCSGIILAFAISQLAAHYELTIQEYLWSDFTWTISMESNLIMTLILTVVSVTRGYLWRRMFNNFHVNRLVDHLNDTKKET